MQNQRNSSALFANGKSNGSNDEVTKMEVEEALEEISHPPPILPSFSRINGISKQIFRLKHTGTSVHQSHQTRMPKMRPRCSNPDPMPTRRIKCHLTNKSINRTKRAANRVTRKRMARIGLKNHKCCQPNSMNTAYRRFLRIFCRKERNCTGREVAKKAARAWSRMSIEKKQSYCGHTKPVLGNSPKRPSCHIQ